MLNDLVEHFGFERLVVWQNDDDRRVSGRGLAEICKVIGIDEFPSHFPTELITDQGKFATRVSSWANGFIGKKLGQLEVSRIGTIAEQNSVPSETQYVDFQEGVMRWAHNGGRGFFRGPGSCYYTDYKSSPQNLEEIGTHSLRIFTPGGGPGRNFHDHFNGIGRAWLTPFDGGIVVTNVYYPKDNRVVVTLLTEMMKKATGKDTVYDEVNVEIQGVYINNGTGFFLRYKGKSPRSSVNIRIKNRWSHRQCSSCRNLFVTRTSADFCEKCGSECGECQRSKPYYGMVYYSDIHSWICSSCASHQYPCHNCGRLYTKSSFVCECERERS